MLNMLRNRHYSIVLIEGQRQTKPALRVAADVVFGFEDIMGRSHLLSQVRVLPSGHDQDQIADSVHVTFHT